MATASENFQSAYLAVSEKIAEMFTDPKPNYTVDNITLNWDQTYDRLMSSAERLLKLPGVAPAPFEVHVDPGAC